MFQTISIVAFIVTFAGIVLNCLVFPCPCCKEYGFHPLKRLVHLMTLLFIEQKLSLISGLRKLVYLLALLCFVVLAITGFYPTLVLGGHISGYLVVVHATFAPVFAICLAVLAVMWACKCRFNRRDWPWFTALIKRVTLIEDSGEEVRCESPCLGQKLTFWLIIFLALPLTLSIVASMFPLFGTHWQEIPLEVHRYVALVFSIAVIVHTYLMVRVQMKK